MSKNWTVIGWWEDSHEVFVGLYPAPTALAAAAKARGEGEELVVMSVHPGHINPSVPDSEWLSVNDQSVCDGCRELYDDGGDGFDGYCPSCADKREAEGVYE